MNYKTVEEVRKLFPYIAHGKIYFNHASIGPLSRLVLSRLNEYFYERSTSKIKNFEAFLAADSGGRENIAKLLNCKADRVTWIDNVSNGMSVLANSLQWQKGDEIILNELEFPANVYPFLNLQKQGVIVKFVKANNGCVLTEDIKAEITDRTKLISISYVQFLTGYRADLEEIGKLCKTNNIIFSVDTIQALGAFAVDVEKCNIDFVCGGTQKWLMGIQGLSYMYIKKELQDKMIQSTVGWLSVEDYWNLLDYNLELKKDASSFMNGSVNLIGIIAVEATTNLLLSFGMDKVADTVLSNSKYLINKLNELDIKPVLSGLEDKYLSGIVSFSIPNAELIQQELEREYIIFEIRREYIRIAPHFYNNKEDFDRFITELKKYL